MPRLLPLILFVYFVNQCLEALFEEMLNYDESENLRNGLKQKYVLQFPVYRITDKDYLVGGKCEGLKPPALEKIGLDYR